mmetsp:Transcript_19032/g.54588  ORF Transcript_19032/g.54588 Transcript_19032/m.54588 type:complete len:324 (+) Transcript_19032:107-1078(+)
MLVCGLMEGFEAAVCPPSVDSSPSAAIEPGRMTDEWAVVAQACAALARLAKSETFRAAAVTRREQHSHSRQQPQGQTLLLSLMDSGRVGVGEAIPVLVVRMSDLLSAITLCAGGEIAYDVHPPHDKSGNRRDKDIKEIVDLEDVQVGAFEGLAELCRTHELAAPFLAHGGGERVVSALSDARVRVREAALKALVRLMDHAQLRQDWQALWSSSTTALFQSPAVTAGGERERGEGALASVWTIDEQRGLAKAIRLMGGDETSQRALIDDGALAVLMELAESSDTTVQVRWPSLTRTHTPRAAPSLRLSVCLYVSVCCVAACRLK